jgi:hypothetical protein
MERHYQNEELLADHDQVDKIPKENNYERKFSIHKLALMSFTRENSQSIKLGLMPFFPL